MKPSETESEELDVESAIRSNHLQVHDASPLHGQEAWRCRGQILNGYWVTAFSQTKAMAVRKWLEYKRIMSDMPPMDPRFPKDR